MACKFKVGDRVELIEDYQDHKKGEQFIVDGFDHTEPIGCDVVDSKGNGFYVFQKRLKLAESTHELHITVKGNETIAVYKHDGKTEKAVAKCSPHDTFDFKVGAKLALERVGVMVPEVEIPEKPKYFTGRVVCVFSKHDFWTVGKIYKVDNGTIYDDEDEPRFYRTEDELRNGTGMFAGTVKFLPIVE